MSPITHSGHFIQSPACWIQIGFHLSDSRDPASRAGRLFRSVCHRADSSTLAESSPGPGPVTRVLASLLPHLCMTNDDTAPAPPPHPASKSTGSGGGTKIICPRSATQSSVPACFLPPAPQMTGSFHASCSVIAAACARARPPRHGGPARRQRPGHRLDGDRPAARQ